MSAPICPCDRFVHPRIISNPAGLTSIHYRVGDFPAFRHALLLARRGETALAEWHPAEGSDLGLQMLEWWAYLADVLTFYNERAIQEGFLRTAVFPEDVRRIIRLLGYRPRPGIGATGVVAALTDSTRPFVLPRGFAIEGASVPGQLSQIFELDDDVPIGTLGRRLPTSARFPTLPGGLRTYPSPRDARGFLFNAVPAKAKVAPTLEIRAGATFKIALDGVVTTVKPNDTFIVIRKDWNGVPYVGVPGDPGPLIPGAPDPDPALPGPTEFVLAIARSVKPVWDATGHAITELEALSAHDLDLAALRKDYRILRATKQAHLWLYHLRYPGSTDPSLLISSGAAQFIERIVDPLGIFVGSGLSSQPAQDPRVLAGTVTTDPPPAHGSAHLEAITRGISAGDPVLFEQMVPGPVPGPQTGTGIAGLFEQIMKEVGLQPPQELPAALATMRAQAAQLVKVTGYSEEIWYANAPQMDRIGQGPPTGPPGHSLVGGLTGAEGPIPIPHSKITFAPNPYLDLMARGDEGLNSIVVHYAWQEIGQIVDPDLSDPTTTVEVPPIAGIPPDVPIPVLIEDVTGTNGAHGWLGRTETVPGEPLLPPMRALVNLLPVSRGETVSSEILGSGDSLLAWQEFVLRRSPLTYFNDDGPSFNGYRSTLRIRVDGIEWLEVHSFYGQSSDARVFVTREDDEQKTHVRFGDGENGARLPAGTDNVVARYRVGSGLAVPPTGTLTSILRPRPGLQAIVNPVPVGGGADPHPREQIRRYAPRSVLTFGRAVSGDDYETVAAQTPGVRRARVYWSWDGTSQRSVVKVFAGDDPAAVAAARAALQAVVDPNRPVLVEQAVPVYPDLSFSVEVDHAYDPESVEAAVDAALTDPQLEPFGSDVVQIGQTVYDSHIYDACLRVPGVAAVRGLRFGVWTQQLRPLDPNLLYLLGLFKWIDPLGLISMLAPLDPLGTLARRVPGTGFYLDDVLQVDPTERHSPGEGSFYLLRPDRLHITAEIRHG
jgi:hypothetical protein